MKMKDMNVNDRTEYFNIWVKSEFEDEFYPYYNEKGYSTFSEKYLDGELNRANIKYAAVKVFRHNVVRVK